MPYEPKPDTGTLFTNDRKTAENQPDMTGDILIALPNGGAKKMRIAGWWKQGQRGEFLSVKLSEPQQRQQQDAHQGEQQPQQNAYQQRTQAAVRASVQPARPRPRQGDPSMRQQAPLTPREQDDADASLPF
jgi:hypothetical protein